MEVGTLVNVRGKLDLSRSEEKTVKVTGRIVRVLNNAYLFNKSGDVVLPLWEDWIKFFTERVEKGSDYFRITNLLVKEFNNAKSLSTCSSTEVKELTDYPNILLEKQIE